MKSFYKAGGVLCLLPATPLQLFSIFTRRAILCFLPCCIFLLLFGLPGARSQSPEKQEAVSGGERQPLKVGEKVPEEFWTREHLFYIDGDTVRKNLEEYKGKLLILDFWATWCGACRANFPKLSHLKESFGDEINIILVNPLIYRDSIGKITKAYNEFSNSTAANLASIVLDEYIIDHFPHLGIPRYIWINPKGRFTASTGNLFVDSVPIKKILEGKY